ncbi:hypothetical protein BJV78DRAFT_1177584 [Lactifluus subvellereus]|nr:hypothetical protein BJV78DRAFT_1177584 [Lactifluus subvellereus]
MQGNEKQKKTRNSTESQPSHHHPTSTGRSTTYPVCTSLPHFFRRSATLYDSVLLVAGEEKEMRLQERIAAELAMNNDPAQYLLTAQHIIEDDYPVPSYLPDTTRATTGIVSGAQTV